MYGKGRAIENGLDGANLDELGELENSVGVRKGGFGGKDAKLAGKATTKKGTRVIENILQVRDSWARGEHLWIAHALVV